jgi:hypothetical protein
VRERAREQLLGRLAVAVQQAMRTDFGQALLVLRVALQETVERGLRLLPIRRARRCHAPSPEH